MKNAVKVLGIIVVMAVITTCQDGSGSGPRGGGTGTGGPGTGGPETGGPETGGPETGGPETGGPETGGPETGGPEIEFTGRTITSNEIGTHDGYGFEYWRDGGTGSMTLGDGGTFKCDWNSRPMQNILFRRGRKWIPSNQTHQQIGDISVNYTASWTPLTDGVSYLCVYGWAINPSGSGYERLVEYYIIDDWGPMNKPPNNWEENRTFKGTIAVDGGVYDIWTSRRTNKPSIQGNTNFMQYWSVRQTRRTSGIISVSKHFERWESLGMPLGNLYEVALTVEGFNSTGTAEITKNELTITR